MKGGALRKIVMIFGVMWLASSSLAEEPSEGRRRVLLLMGGAYHDFRGNVPILVESLEERGGLEVVITKAKSFLTAEELAKFDAVMLQTQGGRLTNEEEQALVDAVEGGKGLVVIHEATTSFAANAEYQRMVGGRSGRKQTYRDLEVTVIGDGPIVAGMPKAFAIQDELLPREGLAESGATVLMRAKAVGSEKDQPVAWIRQHGKGRVFVTTLGHGKASVENETFQRLVYQGLMWTLGRKHFN